MQRSISHKKSLRDFLVYIILYIIYESLSTIYSFLPPLFGVLFILFVHAVRKEDTLSVILISLCLVIFEADKGYILFTSIIYFIFAYKFILPKIIQGSNCVSCIKMSYILLAYLGFYLFNALLANIFLLDMPNLSYHIIYYIIIEFFIVSLL